MKSWTNVEPDRYRLLTKNYTPGRGGQKIRYIVLHHNAGTLSIDQIWQVWQTRAASAHYQVTQDGQIGQLVNDSDTAWHAANQLRNQQSIGIEHANSGGSAQDWPIAEKTLEEGAHLVAALCRYYNLGRPVFGVNIREHKETGSTSCPYHLAKGGKYHARYMARAQYWYDQMGKPAAGSGSQSGGASNRPNQSTDKGAAVTDKLTGDALTARQTALILEQLAGTGKRPDGLPSWTGWDIIQVIDQAKDKLRDTGACTPVEALLIIGEDKLRAIIEEGQK